MTKICNMDGVREYMDGETVELGRSEISGRLVVRAYNECGNNFTEVDLFDVVAWLRTGFPDNCAEPDIGAIISPLLNESGGAIGTDPSGDR